MAGFEPTVSRVRAETLSITPSPPQLPTYINKIIKYATRVTEIRKEALNITRNIHFPTVYN